MRPTCQSCNSMRPPAACTARIILSHPAISPSTLCRACRDSTYRRNGGRLGNDEAGRVERNSPASICWEATSAGPAAGQRRHQDAIGEREFAELDGSRSLARVGSVLAVWNRTVSVLLVFALFRVWRSAPPSAFSPTLGFLSHLRPPRRSLRAVSRIWRLLRGPRRRHAAPCPSADKD
jgi:hypothetical protein